MSDAWAGAWGISWGDSWGTGAVSPTTTRTVFGLFRKKPKKAAEKDRPTTLSRNAKTVDVATALMLWED